MVPQVRYCAFVSWNRRHHVRPLTPICAHSCLIRAFSFPHCHQGRPLLCCCLRRDHFCEWCTECTCNRRAPQRYNSATSKKNRARTECWPDEKRRGVSGASLIGASPRVLVGVSFCLIDNLIGDITLKRGFGGTWLSGGGVPFVLGLRGVIGRIRRVVFGIDRFLLLFSLVVNVLSFRFIDHNALRLFVDPVQRMPS